MIVVSVFVEELEVRKSPKKPNAGPLIFWIKKCVIGGGGKKFKGGRGFKGVENNQGLDRHTKCALSYYAMGKHGSLNNANIQSEDGIENSGNFPTCIKICKPNRDESATRLQMTIHVQRSLGNS